MPPIVKLLPNGTNRIAPVWLKMLVKAESELLGTVPVRLDELSE